METSKHKIGTASVWVADGHLHITQPDPITNKKEWVAIEMKYIEQLKIILDGISETPNLPAPNTYS